MKNYFNIEEIEKILTNNELLSGNFGLEKEGLRVTKDGNLSLTPHPEVFGDKLKNPYITTDFSESQIEIVTPSFNTLNEVYQFLSFISDLVNINIPDNEYIWNQSLPCIIPDDSKIPIAKYSKEGKDAYEYRKNLSKKYGRKLQLISGIHYNFSFDEKVIEKLYKNISHDLSYKNFKNQLYLKIVRNYLRYKWLIIYLTGTSIACHETFIEKCYNLMNKKDNYDSYYGTKAVSYRNASCGYKNKTPLYPRYTSVDEFIRDVKDFINKGLLSESKELYTQIRLKPHDRNNFLKSLKKDGIQYIEIRTIDINPFDKCGISMEDMEFIHIFLLYLLLKEESTYDKWQEESLINEENTAENAFNTNLKLLNDGCEVSLKNWAFNIINEIKQINTRLDLGKDEIIHTMQERIENPKKTHAYKLRNIIKNKGYINSQLSIAKNNKQTSEDIFNMEHIMKNEKLLKYYNDAIEKV